MSGKDYAPLGQHTITDFTVEQDHMHVEPSMPQQNIPLDKQTMPQQSIPQMQYVQPMPQQVPSLQYYPQLQQQMPGQPMPQYYQQLPGQQFPGSGGQPMLGRMVGQTTPFLNSQLQPWTTRLFDCANDFENCIITCFFPCITLGQIAEITDRGMTTCSSAGLIYGLLLYFSGCHWIYSWMYRTKMRQAYSLPEGPCHDFLVHFFCDPCALCQEYRELKNRGFNMNLGWIGNMQLKVQQEAAAGVPPPVQGMIR